MSTTKTVQGAHDTHLGGLRMLDPVAPEATVPVPLRRGPSAATAPVVALAPGLAVAVALPGGLEPFVTVAAWVVAGTVLGLRPGWSSLRQRVALDARLGAVLAATAAFVVVAGLVTPAAGRASLVATVTVLATTVAVRVLQPRPAPRRAVLVGSGQDLERYVGVASDDVVAGCHVLDAGAATPVQQSLPVPTTTSLATLPDLVTAVGADCVLVLPGPHAGAALVRGLTWELEATSVTVGVVCPVESVSGHRLRTRASSGGAVLEVATPRASLWGRCGKAIMDRVGAALLLVVSGPLLLVLWAAVRLDSDGPGFFVQTRVGRDGRPFRMLKLRTMHRNAAELLRDLMADNESDGVLFKIRRDPRITRVGSWLRRSSLDELPQLVNVLRGDMSLVGPRPALPEEVATYDAVALRRLAVNPGITGLWQVSGRSDLLWEESLRLDLYYADNWRLRDDVGIGLRTVGAVVAARGAY
ncbi:MAG: exopolysaccharide biosynthesis polyprenyl glycosylphosphotransferase [Nocardioidaceae bacterium]